ncbi:MAG: hypothetical protein EB084_09525 [Proteobacteria bacterium]|nr:hypothetical protein [Pseudomonadota bacterium]
MDYIHANPDDIIGTIRALLTGDRSVDVPFVQQQKVNYQSHPEAEHIAAELDGILSEIKARAEYERIMHQQRRRCDAMIREATAAVKVADLERAENILVNLVNHDTATSDRNIAWYDFQDPIERLYVEALGLEKREIRDAVMPLVGGYQLLCAVLLQADRPHEALNAIDAAIALNKVAIMPRLERSYCLQRLGRIEELKRNLSDAFPLCYTQVHFGQWYRSLAPWYFHTQDFVGFGVCLLLSLACVEDESVRTMLAAAEQLAEIAYDDTFAANVSAEARAREIPLNPAPIWHDLAMRLARQTLEDESYERALRYLTIAYDLNRSDELLAQIERLRAHMATLTKTQT